MMMATCWGKRVRSTRGTLARYHGRRSPATDAAPTVAAQGRATLRGDSLVEHPGLHDPLARQQPIDDVHSLDDLSKRRVTSIEVRLRRLGDEELAAPGVTAGERHSDGASPVRHAVVLAALPLAWSSVSIAAGISCL